MRRSAAARPPGAALRSRATSRRARGRRELFERSLACEGPDVVPTRRFVEACGHPAATERASVAQIPNVGSSQNSGFLTKVAAEAAGTALTPLTGSSTATAPCAKAPLGFVEKPRKLPTIRENPRAFTNSQHHWCTGLSLHTEPVSGICALSAVSAAPVRECTQNPEILRRTQT